MIYKENVIIALWQGKIIVLTFNDKFCEGQAFSYLLPTGKFGYNSPGGISISLAQYFNQRLLNFNHYFASHRIQIYTEYIFLAQGSA